MNVVTARTAGFCFGVKRAVDKVYELISSGDGPIYTLGPIIHNEQVVSDLDAKGVRVIEEKDLDALDEGVVVIRSHGIGKAVYEKLKARGLAYVDVTCPFVLKIHRIVERESQRGAHIVIIGDRNHPEVQGICGWCDSSENAYTVIKDAQDAENFVPPEGKEICVVSQTTFNYNKFQELVEILSKKRYYNNVLNVLINVLNTICNATEERQKEAKHIAGEVDTMLVVGGKHSSNTQKLFEICKKECENTYYIQTPVDLDSEMFQCSSYVGITAGASTPKNIIEEVQEHVRIKF